MKGGVTHLPVKEGVTHLPVKGGVTHLPSTGRWRGRAVAARPQGRRRRLVPLVAEGLRQGAGQAEACLWEGLARRRRWGRGGVEVQARCAPPGAWRRGARRAGNEEAREWEMRGGEECADA